MQHVFLPIFLLGSFLHGAGMSWLDKSDHVYKDIYLNVYQPMRIKISAVCDDVALFCAWQRGDAYGERHGFSAYKKIVKVYFLAEIKDGEDCCIQKIDNKVKALVDDAYFCKDALKQQEARMAIANIVQQSIPKKLLQAVYNLKQYSLGQYEKNAVLEFVDAIFTCFDKVVINKVAAMDFSSIDEDVKNEIFMVIYNQLLAIAQSLTSIREMLQQEHQDFSFGEYLIIKTNIFSRTLAKIFGQDFCAIKDIESVVPFRLAEAEVAVVLSNANVKDDFGTASPMSVRQVPGSPSDNQEGSPDHVQERKSCFGNQRGQDNRIFKKVTFSAEPTDMPSYRAMKKDLELKKEENKQTIFDRFYEAGLVGLLGDGLWYCGQTIYELCSDQEALLHIQQALESEDSVLVALKFAAISLNS